jgi:transposase
MKVLACDVSKDTLVSFDGLDRSKTANEPEEIVKLLTAHPDHAVVCEPTSVYHLKLVEAAVRLGHKVYLVNPKEARNYKDSLSFRAKTDPLDARYLYEYLRRNEDLLRPYKPPSPELERLRKLLGERHVVVESRTALAQSFGKQCSAAQKKVIESLCCLVKDLERQMAEIARGFESYEILRTIPGVGPLSGYALLFALESIAFESPEALIAFLGLDVRIRESGRFKGRQKLTKRGDPVLRFLLCFAGRGLLTSRFGASKKAELLARRRHFPERLVIAARKILRTAFALFSQKICFDEEKWRWGVDKAA